MPDCPFSAEKIKHPTSVYCIDGQCEWFHGEPRCPHPVACDAEGRCVHTTDNHEEWRRLNAEN